MIGLMRDSTEDSNVSATISFTNALENILRNAATGSSIRMLLLYAIPDQISIRFMIDQVFSRQRTERNEKNCDDDKKS